MGGRNILIIHSSSRAASKNLTIKIIDFEPDKDIPLKPNEMYTYELPLSWIPKAPSATPMILLKKSEEEFWVESVGCLNQSAVK